MKRHIPPGMIVIVVLMLPWSAFAQASLKLSSSTGVSGGTVSLALSLAGSSGTNMAGLEWTLTYPGGVSNISVAAGAAVSAAGKTLHCTTNSFSYTCMASGMNANVIADGAIATVTATVSGSSANIGVTNTLGVDTSGGAVPVTGTGGTVSLPAPGVTVNSIGCNPLSLAPGATSTCSVTLSGPAGSGGATVALGTTGSIGTGAASLAIAAGSNGGTFTATAGQFSSNQSATITASLNGASSTATFSLTIATTLSSLQCTASTLSSNASTTCTVTLSKAAPAGGAVVAISGAIANLLTLPASVTVPANATSATFTASAGSVPSGQTAAITASLNGSLQQFSLSFTASVLISSVQCADHTLVSNATTTCTVTLSGSAPAGGEVVTLSETIANFLMLPASVNVPANATRATFTASTGSILSTQIAGIIAAVSIGGARQIAATWIELITGASGPTPISSLQCTASTLASNGSTTCTITLIAAAPAGGAVVTISGGIAKVLTLPASVSVPANATSVTFMASTGSIPSTQTATITASLNGFSQLFSLSLTAPVLISSVHCTASILASNASTTCTVTLNGAAPPGGAVVTISGGIANVLTLPASVTVPANSTSATFTARTGSIASGQAATITASLNGFSQAFSFSLKAPVLISSVQCADSTLASNASTICTVTLAGAAPASGEVVTLSGTIANVLMLPASVTVPANATSTTFTVSAGSILTTQIAGIIAAVSIGGVRQIAATWITLTAGSAGSMQAAFLQCTIPTLASNTSTTCTVTLPAAAPAGGASVGISGAIANVLTLPASVSVPENSTTVTFPAVTGTITEAQTATITASYGSSRARAAVSLVSGAASRLASLTCSPRAIQPGNVGSCTVLLSKPAPSITNVAVKFNNAGIQVPSSVTIAGGASDASFAFPTSQSLSGWLIIQATLENVTKSAVLPIGPPGVAGNTMNLACPQTASPGATAVCELQWNSRAARTGSVRLSSTSSSVKIPSLLQVRAGQRNVRFAVTIAPFANPENVVVHADSDTEASQSDLQIELSNQLVLNVPGEQNAKPSSSLRFRVSATAADGFPVALAASELPSNASFAPGTGDFEWTPTSQDVGARDLAFTATNSFGVSSSKWVHIYVGAGAPELTELRNTAGPAATAACTPGSMATLVGRFLFAGDTPVAEHSGATLDLQKTQVWVNGIRTPVLFASINRVDFLCPQDVAGTPLEIALQSGTNMSNTLKTTMMAEAPGILSADGKTGQALAFRSGSSKLAAIPNPQFQASPVIAGELLSVLASGVSCDENFSTGRPQLQFGMHVMPVQAIRSAAGYAGACELTFQVPAGVTGDNLPIRLQIVHYDGASTSSNPASIAIGDQ